MAVSAGMVSTPVPCPSLVSPGVSAAESELLDPGLKSARTSASKPSPVGVGIVVVELSPLVVHGLVRIVPSAKSSIGKPMRCAYFDFGGGVRVSEFDCGQAGFELGVDIALRSARSACRSAREVGEEIAGEEARGLIAELDQRQLAEQLLAQA